MEPGKVAAWVVFTALIVAVSPPRGESGASAQAAPPPAPAVAPRPTPAPAPAVVAPESLRAQCCRGSTGTPRASAGARWPR